MKGYLFILYNHKTFWIFEFYALNTFSLVFISSLTLVMFLSIMGLSVTKMICE